MNNSYKIFAVILISAFFSACSGGDDNAEIKTAANANSAVVSTQTNSYVASNGETMQPAFNAEIKEPTNSNAAQSNINIAANAATVDSSTGKNVESISDGIPAADNSTYAAEMNESGKPVETRTFKSHPILLKVEKITLSPRDYIFKVYLKDGKVVETKSEELKQFRYIAPENILDAIGKLPKATLDPNGATKDGKNKQSMMQPPNP